MKSRYRKRKLRKEIRLFSRIKGFVAIPLILIGVLGLVLPIIPGTVFLVVGVILLVPSFEEKMKSWFGKNIETN